MAYQAGVAVQPARAAVRCTRPCGYTCCVSDNHSQRLDRGLLTKGSFKNPTLVKPSDLVMVPPTIPPPPATPTPAPLSGAAAPSAAPPTISAISTIAANHAVRPMVVERVNSDLWLLITPTILDDDTSHCSSGKASRDCRCFV